MLRDQSFQDRFYKNVSVRGDDECWPWIGVRLRAGYGQFNHRYTRIVASRVAWELANQRTIPHGLFACHSCDNPPCCNPRHIWLGTASDNVRDMVAKGRHRGFCPRHSDYCKRGHRYDTQRPYPSQKQKRHCHICHTITKAAKKAASA